MTIEELAKKHGLKLSKAKKVSKINPVTLAWLRMISAKHDYCLKASAESVKLYEGKIKT